MEPEKARFSEAKRKLWLPGPRWVGVETWKRLSMTQMSEEQIQAIG